MKIEKTVWCPFNQHHVKCLIDLPPGWADMSAAELGEAIRIDATVIEPELPPSQFTCPKCGSHFWATRNHGGPLAEWIGFCKGGRYGEQPTLCDFEWPRTDDAKYGIHDGPTEQP